MPILEETSLDFEKADFGPAGDGLKCAICSSRIQGDYYDINGLHVCANCQPRLAELGQAEAGFGAFVLSGVLGLAGGAVGAAVWYAIATLFKFELSLIAILTGWLVGRGVQKGSGGRGGLEFQILAACITYICIAATYAPAVYEALKRYGTVATSRLIELSLELPFRTLPENILGIIILGIGVRQAWIMTGRRALEIKGPFRLAAAPVSSVIAPRPGGGITI